jgi:Zinc knuckle
MAREADTSKLKGKAPLVEHGTSDGEPAYQGERRESYIPVLGEPETGYMRKEDFLEHCTSQPEALFDFLDDLICKKDDEISGLEDVLDKLKNRNAQRMEGYKSQIEKLMEERDEYKEAFARKCLEERSNTRGSVPPEAGHRSEKIPDPEQLTDGKEPRFEDWLARVQRKLRSNADRYPTEELKITYIQNRTAGKAARHLEPRMRDNAPNRFTTADEVYKYLEARFGDKNKKAKARREFRELKMKPSDEYGEFLANFLLLAGDSQLPEEEYIEELFDRLTPRLREMVVFFQDNSASFEKFSERCAKAADSLQFNYKTRTQNKKNALKDSKTTSSGTRNGENTGRQRKEGTLASRAEEKSYPSHFSAEKQELMRTGSCFKCKGPGHLARDCPHDKKISDLNVDSENDMP